MITLLLGLLSTPALAGGVEAAFEAFQADYEDIVVEQKRAMRAARTLTEETAAVERAGDSHQAAQLRRAAADATRDAFDHILQLDARLGVLEAVLAPEPAFLWIDLRAKVGRIRDRVDDTVAFGVEEVFLAELRALVGLPAYAVRGQLDVVGWRFVDQHAHRIVPDRLYGRVLEADPPWFAERDAAARCLAVCSDLDLRAHSHERLALANLQDAQVARDIGAWHSELQQASHFGDIYRLTQVIDAAVVQRTDPEIRLLRGPHTVHRVALTAAERLRVLGDVPGRREHLERAAANAPGPSARRDIERELSRVDRWSLLTVSGLAATDGFGAVIDLGVGARPHVRATVGPDRLIGGGAIDLRRSDPWQARWLVPVGVEAGVRDGDALTRATAGLSREWPLGHPGRKLRVGVTSALGYAAGLDAAAGLEVGVAVHPR